jgi:diacylglycerol O-acyltransferase/trehalose O-mycolyltransferase
MTDRTGSVHRPGRSPAAVRRPSVGGTGMRRVVLMALVLGSLAAGCGGGGGATPAAATRSSRPDAVVQEYRPADRQLDLTVRSEALGRTAQVRLLTPDGWKPGASRRWPVLYLLHGCCDTYDSWTRSTGIARLPQLRDVLVVMPEGGDVGFYSDWLDGPAWQDFHLREVPRILEEGYGAGTRRAIAGLSMGGLGAMDYAARRPRMFRAAASFSGVLHPLATPDLWLGLFASYTDDPDAVWGDPREDRASWRRHDPTALLPALDGIPLFVSAGDGRPGPFEDGRGDTDPTEVEVGKETRAFVRRAKALGVPVRSDLYGAGIHDWPYWQRELYRALPLLLGAIR